MCGIYEVKGYFCRKMANDTLFSTLAWMIADGKFVSLMGNEVATNRSFSFESDETVGFEAYVFVLVESGEAAVEINYIPFQLKQNSMLMLKPYMIVTAFKAGPSFHARYLFLDRMFFASIPESIQFHALQNKMVNSTGMPAIKLDAAEFNEVSTIFHSICEFIPHHPSVKPMMLALLSYMLLIVTEAMWKNLEMMTLTANHKDVLFQNFLQQLCLHYAERHDIGFYAQNLQVSVRYLQKVVKDITGRTVYSYISERLRIHARRLLASSDMTIEQIAFVLHFSSPSAFGKFFKTNCGMSPKQFREQAKEDRVK